MVERGGAHTYSHLRAIEHRDRPLGDLDVVEPERIELGDALAECRTIAQARFHRLALIPRAP